MLLLTIISTYRVFSHLILAGVFNFHGNVTNDGRIYISFQFEAYFAGKLYSLKIKSTAKVSIYCPIFCIGQVTNYA